MSGLTKNHPISIALRKSKVSKDLIKEFTNCLKEFSFLEQQALYLLVDKGIKVEEIIEDLYEVPVKDQADWRQPEEITFEDEAATELPPPPELPEDSEHLVMSELTLRSSFKDWKQEHGFESIPVEVGDIHTFIRFEPVTTNNLEEKFKWTFNRARYGKRGWGNERLIKSIKKSLLDNNNNPGWVVKGFLEENKLLTDENHEERTGEEIPNPMILSSRDSHAMLFLLLGHPFFYYQDNVAPIRNSFKKVEYRVNVHTHAKHKVLAGAFFSIERDGSRKEIITDDFVENGFLLYGLPKSIVHNNMYYRIQQTTLPAKMIRDSFKGVLIPDEEWKDFIPRWEKWYPVEELYFVDPHTSDTPDFSARSIKDWKYWLIEAEDHQELFNSDEEKVWIKLHKDTNRFNSNKMGVNIENYDEERIGMIMHNKHPKAFKLFQTLKHIRQGKFDEGYYQVERHSASQLIILSEEYPYAKSYSGQHLVGEGNLAFRITVKKNPDNRNQYLLQGEIGEITYSGGFLPIFKEDEVKRKAIGIIPSFLLHNDQLIRIGSMISGRLINDTMAGVIVEESEISDFYATALPYLRQRGIKIHDPEGLLRVSALYNYKIRGEMTIWEVHGMLMGRLDTIMHTDIGDFSYPFEVTTDEFEQVMDGQLYKVPKDLAQEQKLRDELYEVGWVDEGVCEYAMREDQSLKFVLDILPNQNPDSMITYFGAKKLKRWKTKSVQPAISTNIQSGMDWFNVNIDIKLDGKLLNLKNLVELWKTGNNAIELPDNNGIAVIDQEWLTKYAPVLNRLIQSNKRNKDLPKPSKEESKDKGELLQVEKYQLGLLSELEQISEDSIRDEEWEKLVGELQNFTGIKKRRIPNTVHATLRDYQREGVNWLCFLRDYGFGGILADDMGLGKTLQAITYMAIEKRRGMKKPCLVIAPTSVVTNWVAEINKFVPTFSVVLLHGQKRKTLYETAKKSDVIITTYGLLQRDIEWLSAQEYHLVILDEAQMIKNARSRTAQAVQQLNSKQRLTLTGTPIENSVSELWSQFNFLMPGFFGSLKEFERDYIKPRKTRKQIKKPDLGLLRRQTKPFILRRLKQHVATELPEKTEQTLYCEMNERQRQLYESVMEIVRRQVKEKVSVDGIKGAQITIFDALLKLRQICCDPRLSSLVGEEEEPPQSAKMKLFVETVQNIVEEGHRVLIFSQFVKMLNLMHKDLEEANIPFLQLDGSSRNREQLVERFQQSDEYPVFLISLKAGGTGINLTAADYVIHFDPWWNPAAEAQATDRVHRIGQKNRVFVYKLITRNSIEEKIINLQEKKQALANKVVGTSEPLDKMINMEDLQDLFAL